MELIAALVSLIDGSSSSKEKVSLLKAVLGVLQGLNIHIHKNLQFVSKLDLFSNHIDAVIARLAEELKRESE